LVVLKIDGEQVLDNAVEIVSEAEDPQQAFKDTAIALS
jgi:hypothetical protein